MQMWQRSQAVGGDTLCEGRGVAPATAPQDKLKLALLALLALLAGRRPQLLLVGLAHGLHGLHGLPSCWWGNVPLKGLLAHVARGAGNVTACPSGGPVEQLRKRVAEMTGRGALTLLDHLGGASTRPYAHQQVTVVRLDRQRPDLPSLLVALPSFGQFPAPCCHRPHRPHRPHQHRLATAWAPDEMVDDEMVDDEMDTVFIAMVLVRPVHIPNSSRTRTTWQAASSRTSG